MALVTIVSDDAERLVREGGVHNDPYGLPEPIPHDEPFEAAIVESRGGSWNQDSRVWRRMVSDVHHARECSDMWHEDDPDGGPFCGPGAQADMWHWTVDPIDA